MRRFTVIGGIFFNVQNAETLRTSKTAVLPLRRSE
jgi:hypothetical protein